jgi:AbrB family looped-hinge helix DNA binding protein
MLAELRTKSQITIPKELVDRLGLAEGDKLDIYEKDGVLCIIPVVVYPKKYLDELREEIEATKAKISSGEQPVFDNVDALFAKLEEN